MEFTRRCLPAVAGRALRILSTRHVVPDAARRQRPAASPPSCPLPPYSVSSAPSCLIFGLRPYGRARSPVVLQLPTAHRPLATRPLTKLHKIHFNLSPLFHRNHMVPRSTPQLAVPKSTNFASPCGTPGNRNKSPEYTRPPAAPPNSRFGYPLTPSPRSPVLSLLHRQKGPSSIRH
jgi:hypothetical protein